MKWVYYDYMGKSNPVCKDVGEILRIVPNLPAVQYTYSNILEIETDSGLFSCDTKYKIMLYGGYCVFEPIRGENVEPEFIDLTGIRQGDIVDVKPNEVYQIKSSFLTPITTDPRVLCIMHRSHALKGEALQEFCKHIPTRDEAVAYLRSINAQTDCLPWCAVVQKINNERD